MDPRHLFFDDRLRTSACVYCGAVGESRDHCPSKVLLDEPLPFEVRTVAACRFCNEGFSADEEYVACLVECVLCGSTEPEDLRRPKIQRILQERPELAGTIKQSSRKDSAGKLVWIPDLERVRNVVLKLARGHLAYECAVLALEEPSYVNVAPLLSMSESDRRQFESVSEGVVLSTGNILAPWPEIGTRAFLRAAGALPTTYSNGWIVVQPQRYRYRASELGNVDIVLSEYLACSLAWEEV